MNNMAYKIWNILCFYILLMIIVSSCSRLFDNQNSFSLFNGTQFSKEINKQEINIQQKEQIMVEVESTTTTPFSFEVNITAEELVDNYEVAPLYSQILLTEPTDIMVEMSNEIEKRKAKIWYRRKFALYMIKNRIKILKLKKFWFKNKNKLS